MKHRLLFAILAIALIAVGTVRTFAAEPTLEDVLDTVGFSQRTLVSTETFPAGNYIITMYAEYAGFRDQNQLRWYKVGTSNFNLIFDGPEGVPPGDPMGLVVPPLTKYFAIGDNFGLSLLSPDGTFYSETSRNPDLQKHAKIYQSQTNPNLYLIGFENMGAQSSSDFDYNDMVISLQYTGPAVGGEWAPITVQALSPMNTLQLLAPWITVALTVGVAGSFVGMRRIKKRKD